MILAILPLSLSMGNDIKLGDLVEVTRTTRGGYFKGRYPAVVISWASRGRIKVRSENGQEHLPYTHQVKKLE